MTLNRQSLRVFGDAQENAVDQMAALVKYGSVAGAALMADHHFGYSQPIGGVVAYRDQISPSGVGFDIACGNKAVKTDLTMADIESDLPGLADEIFYQIEFGVGRNNNDPISHPLFESDAWDVLEEVAGRNIRASLQDRAYNQLGTVGSGNHYVDVFVEKDGLKFNFQTGLSHEFYHDSPIWVGVHFGSRGLGHNIATGFLKLAVGMEWDQKPAKGERYEREEPTLFDLDSELGQAYWTLMGLAGEYAYAGRDYVTSKVTKILGGKETESVHNHHNFAWKEQHGDDDLVVVRKGATPLWPDQKSFIGGSMCDISVIVEGIDSPQAVDTFRSTVHGAGRVMGRMEAKGKVHRKTGEVIRPGKVTPEMMAYAVDRSGIELRGGGLDESPFVYRNLSTVLDAHRESTRVLNILQPLIVCMAGANTVDPWKD
jgi:tRNA-splicing ligase RtcB